MESVGVRVSGGHLCEAEALSEPESEYLRRYYNIIKTTTFFHLEFKIMRECSLFYY